MHTGQIIFTIGALGLLSLAIINLNTSISENDVSLAQNRYRLEALSLINSYIEQSSSLYFDEVTTDTSLAKDLSTFSVTLQTEPNDSGTFDDFDDYNNITRIDTGLSGVQYRVMFDVEYVRMVGGSIVPAGTRTWHKRMTVSVTDNYLGEPILYRNFGADRVRDTLRVSFVNSYWFYN
ncbi:MAG: hypothetical protein EH225_10125 [Calditrichaeota bacterium]|nr:hypothetical protein [Calditrichota bacterium]RQW00789.1 MAG: hypothetical protein EH225_10125 [Calditrichota bacterium]